MSTTKSYATVDDYIQAQPEATRKALLQLRSYILEAAPNAIETFNYNIPAFSLVENGKRDQQIMIAGYTNHVGLYPHPSTIQFFGHELGEYKTGKGSVQFPVTQPLPKSLIIRMVAYRLKLVREEA